MGHPSALLTRPSRVCVFIECPPVPPPSDEDASTSMVGEASWWLPEDLDWVTATTATLLTASR